MSINLPLNPFLGANVQAFPRKQYEKINLSFALRFDFLPFRADRDYIKNPQPLS